MDIAGEGEDEGNRIPQAFPFTVKDVGAKLELEDVILRPMFTVLAPLAGRVSHA